MSFYSIQTQIKDYILPTETRWISNIKNISCRGQKRVNSEQNYLRALQDFVLSKKPIDK